MLYLDHAATTPLDPKVAEAMLDFLQDRFGNPNSVYRFGQESRNAMEEARRKIAAILNCNAGEIIFTSGGTEADNLAIKGVAWAKRNKGRHIITSAIEHHAVLHTCQYLERQGFEVTYLPVDKYGMVDPQEVKNALKQNTILVSIMQANNEIGTIQPIAEIGEILANTDIYFHTDAVQTVGHIPVDVQELQVDLLSFSAHKFHGPKGIGGLFVRQGTAIDPLLHGGGQERGLRSGTENVAGIVGMAVALEIATENMAQNIKKQTAMRDRLLKEIPEKIAGAHITGHPLKRLPGNASFCFEDVDGESIVLKLDMEGICASTGSACSSGSLEPSHVLLALGLSKRLANGSLRLTLGRDNTEEDINRVLQILPRVVSNLRAMSAI